MRSEPADSAAMRAHLLGDDRQLRQPILLATADATIAAAPLQTFLRRRNDLDTLGIDAPGTECESPE